MNSADNQLDLLLSKLLDGSLDEADRLALAQLLRADAAARQTYLSLMLTDAALRSELEQSPDHALAPLVKQSGPAAPARRLLAPLIGFMNCLPKAIQPPQHWGRFLLVATALTSLFWSVILIFIWWPSLKERGEPALAEQHVAVISRLQAVVWQADAPAGQVGSRLMAGQELRVQQGLLELMFSGGARVVIEGPAELRVDAAGAMSLESGKLLARMPARARGFTLLTPTVEIVDLGTEFGVTVQNQGTELQVFEGSVQIAPHGSTDAAPKTYPAGSAALFENLPQQGFHAKDKNMNRLTYLSLATILALPAAAPLHAVPISVPNYSFETAIPPGDGGPLGDGGANGTNVNGDTTTIAGWIYGITTAGSGGLASAGVFNPANAHFPLSTGGPVPATGDGNQVVYINLSSTGSGQASKLTSASSLGSIVGNSTYTLTVAVGKRLDRVAADVEIALLAGGTPISGATGTITGSSITGGTFVDVTASFTTAISGDPLVGQPLTIRLTHSKTTLDLQQIAFDNVRLSVTELPPPAVPEPSSAALLLLGSGGWALLRSRSSRRQQSRR